MIRVYRALSEHSSRLLKGNKENYCLNIPSEMNTRTIQIQLYFPLLKSVKKTLNSDQKFSFI